MDDSNSSLITNSDGQINWNLLLNISQSSNNSNNIREENNEFSNCLFLNNYDSINDEYSLEISQLIKKDKERSMIFSKMKV